MRTFYLIALVAWIIGGTLWSKSTFCGSKKAKPSAKVASGAAATGAVAAGDCNRSLIMSNGDFEASTSGNFMFSSSTTRFKTPSDEFAAVLSEVASYLTENEDKTMLIEGLYFEKEENKTSADNLGLARAAVLKTYLEDEYGIASDQLLEGSKLTKNVKCYYNKDSKTITKGAVATFGVK